MWATYNKGQLQRGAEFVLTFTEGDGTISTDVTGATISIWDIENGVRVMKLTADPLTQLNSSTWTYIWQPTSSISVPSGRYTVEYIVSTASDTIRIYDEFDVVQSTKNSIYMNIPTLGTPVINPSKSYAD